MSASRRCKVWLHDVRINLSLYTCVVHMICDSTRASRSCRATTPCAVSQINTWIKNLSNEMARSGCAIGRPRFAWWPGLPGPPRCAVPLGGRALNYTNSPTAPCFSPRCKKQAGAAQPRPYSHPAWCCIKPGRRPGCRGISLARVPLQLCYSDARTRAVADARHSIWHSMRMRRYRHIRTGIWLQLAPQVPCPCNAPVASGRAGNPDWNVHGKARRPA